MVDSKTQPPESSLPAASPDWTSIKRKAVRGSAWWAAIYPILKVIQITGTVVLAALLSPEAIGVVAISTVVVQAAIMLSEFGVTSALIQSPRSDERFVNTAWTMQLVRGTAVFLVSVGIAPTLAEWYSVDSLRYLIPAIGFGAVINGLRSTKYALLNRELLERPRALLHLAEAIVSRGTMIGIALVWPSPWSLVIGTLVGMLVLTVGSHVLPGMRNRLRWDGSAARAILKFGSWVFVGTVIAFLGSQLDPLILGKLTEGEQGALRIVGVYAIARRLAMLPLEASDMIGNRIAFPVLALVARHDRQRYAKRLLQVRSAVLPMGVSLCLGVVAMSPWFFLFLFDYRYAEARWIAPLLAMTAWMGTVNSFANSALLSLGLTRALAVSSGLGAAVTLVGVVIGYRVAGVAGFVLGTTAGKLVEHVVDLVSLARNGFTVYAQDARVTLSFLALACLCAASNGAAESSAPGSTGAYVGWTLPIVVLGMTVWVAARAGLKQLRSLRNAGGAL